MTYDTQTTTTTTSTIGGHSNSDEENLTNAIAITVASLATVCALAYIIKCRRDARREENLMLKRSREFHANREPNPPVDPSQIPAYATLYNDGFDPEREFSPESSIVSRSPSPFNGKNHDYEDPKNLKINKESNTNSENHDYEYVDPPALKGAASVSNDSRHLPRRHTTDNMLGGEPKPPSTQTSNTDSRALDLNFRGPRHSMV